MKNLLAIVALTFVWMCGWTGCSLNGGWSPVNPETPVVTTVPTVPAIPGVNAPLKRALVFGLGQVNPEMYGGWNGQLGKTLEDAAKMRDLLELRGYSVVFLTNNLATSYRVTAACVASMVGMKKGDKFYVYGSSHGGQVVDTSGDENGGKDSTICLWDGQFTDDLIYAMLLRAPECEVDLCFDACNTGTSFRGGVMHDPVRVFKARERKAKAGEPTLKCSLFYMGGCGDGESSYEDRFGGVFTRTLLKTGPGTLTRIQWFNAVLKAMPRNQVPVFNELGVSIKDKGALQ